MIENFDNKNIQSFEYETSINSDGNIVGTCELGNATIQMLNDSNEYSLLKGQWIKTIHGSFYIHSVEPVQEKVNIKLSCYDVKYKLDIPYDSSLYTWPMTLKEWRNQIGTNCGITFDNSDFPNSDLILNEEPYIGDNPSSRTVISIIAQAGCSWVDTDKDDIFYFNWFDNTIHIVNDWIELTTEKEMSSPINVVVLGRGDVEDNVKWPEILPENPVEFRIDNNYILDPQESTEDKRYDVIETIYNRVNGFKYLVFNIRTQDIFNKLSIKLGQIVTYRDMWGNVLSANIMSKKITYLGGNLEDDDNYEITLSAEEIKETSTEYSYTSSIENKLRKAQITVDKQNQRIETIASDVNENAEKVASLEITTGNISTKVSSVEKDLSTTNTSLSNLSNTVDTLRNDIDGVSADFEDFKNNEYIQSIDNLQKQIDGAIQFWNGAEIPTLENYPANQWTTENDKINHQADIYTVVQDVEGEMKQGKSYRFDKIDGVWQWIELTDNELSAVQAIAQEALNKANTNATEIGTIKTNVSQLQQTDDQIKASVESIDKQIIPTATATGSNIYVEDASDNPLIQLEIEGKSVQSETPTPDTPAEIESVGYENFLNYNNFTSISNNGLTTTKVDNTLLINGTSTGTSFLNIINDSLNLKAGTYTLSVSNPIASSDNDMDIRITTIGGASVLARLYLNVANNTTTFTLPENLINGRLQIRTSSGVTLDNYILFPQLTKGTTYHNNNIPYGKYGIEIENTNEIDTKTTLLILNEPLRSLPNGVKDIAYIRNNKLYVDRYVGSRIFDGTESWDFTEIGTTKQRFELQLGKIGLTNITNTRSERFCSHFVFVDSNTGTWGQYYMSNEWLVIKDNDNVIKSLDEFKTWANENPFEITYELEEPYTEEVGKIKMPSTFKGANHILTTDELEPTINIEYVRDTVLSNYIEGQINKVMTIEERHYSELVIEDNQIKESVTEINSNLSDMSQDVHTVQETLTSTEKKLEVISTNIDKTTGEIREVTTINGYKFNKDGLNIYTNENSFNTLIDNEGTYYKDGDAIISETTKDGFMATSIKNKGSEEYCYDNTNKVYEFVKERIEVDGEYGYATFYNGVN